MSHIFERSDLANEDQKRNNRKKATCQSLMTVRIVSTHHYEAGEFSDPVDRGKTAWHSLSVIWWDWYCWRKMKMIDLICRAMAIPWSKSWARQVWQVWRSHSRTSCVHVALWMHLGRYVDVPDVPLIEDQSIWPKVQLDHRRQQGVSWPRQIILRSWFCDWVNCSV